MSDGLGRTSWEEVAFMALSQVECIREKKLPHWYNNRSRGYKKPNCQKTDKCIKCSPNSDAVVNLRLFVAFKNVFLESHFSAAFVRICKAIRGLYSTRRMSQSNGKSMTIVVHGKKRSRENGNHITLLHELCRPSTSKKAKLKTDCATSFEE